MMLCYHNTMWFWWLCQGDKCKAWSLPLGAHNVVGGDGSREWDEAVESDKGLIEEIILFPMSKL